MNIEKLLPKILEGEKSPIVCQLLGIIQQQAEEIQCLKDEIARLKGQKPKPTIKPSNLGKESDKDKRGKGRSKRKKKSKRKNIKIHKDVIIEPDTIPSGSKFIDYKDFIVQDIIFQPFNVRYRRARWRTPAGDYLTGELPKDVTGHFGPGLISFVLYQYHGCHVTQPLLIEQLREVEIDISTGQINNILIENKDDFHKEKKELLVTGLSMSGHVHVDDTGARHKGRNGYCTHIGNEYFAWFESTESKSRINFLRLLRMEYTDFIINDDALEYMVVQGLPLYQRNKIAKVNGTVFKDEKEWVSYLTSVDVIREHHVRIATEGALVGSIIDHGFNKELAIMSDDAGQFNVFLHALCWVHAERLVHKLIGYTDHNKTVLEQTRKAIWQLYRDLKDYQLNPDNATKSKLEKQFDELFTRKTGFATLDNTLKRIYKNKLELLLVLERPDIPLHNNLSESDIREYVKRRKVSGSTRSDTGKKCRDTFTSLKKTCRKLGISFWKYLDDRVRKKNQIPRLADIMKLRMAE